MTVARRVDAFLFDKDGTLFDFAATWEFWAESFLLRAAQGNRQLAETAGHRIGFDLHARAFAPDSIAIASSTGELADVLAGVFERFSVPEMLTLLNEESEIAPQVEAVPLARLLGDLRAAGLRLGVATNDSEAPALAHLERAGVRDLFDFIAGFDSGHGAKPGHGQMLAFASATGLPCARIAMVGDSTHDLVAGRSAGMQTIGVLTGLAGHDELAPHADIVLPDIGHLPTWLEQNLDDA